MIARAMDKANWAQVKELSERARAVRQAVEGKQGAIETARAVYAVSDVRLDPFSPGLAPFVALPTRDLSALRTRAVEQMTVLEQMDAPLRDFYAGRRAAFGALVLATPEQSGATASAGATGDAREAAAEALAIPRCVAGVDEALAIVREYHGQWLRDRASKGTGDGSGGATPRRAP